MWAIRAPVLLARVALWKLPSSVSGHVIWVPAVERVNRDQTALRFLFETLSRLAEALDTASDMRRMVMRAEMISLVRVYMLPVPFDRPCVGGVNVPCLQA